MNANQSSLWLRYAKRLHYALQKGGQGECNFALIDCRFLPVRRLSVLCLGLQSLCAAILMNFMQRKSRAEFMEFNAERFSRKDSLQ